MRFIIIFLLSLILFPIQQASAEEVRDWGMSTEVEPTKQWTITFKSTVDSSAFEHINVVDEQSNVKPMKKTLNAAKNAVILTPITPYVEDVIYTLQISKQLKSAEDERLVQGGEKRFYVPKQQPSNITLVNGVKQTTEFLFQSSQKVGDETSYQFTYNGTTKYAVNDLIVVENTRQFENGFAGKVTAVSQQNGQYVLTMVKAPLEDVVESLTISEESFLTAEQLRTVTVAGFDVQAYNVKDTALNLTKGELKLTPKLNATIKGVDAQAEFAYILKDLKLNIDVDVSKTLKLKKVRISISGKQTIEGNAKFGRITTGTATISERPSLKKKDSLKDFEYKLIRLPIVLSIPGVSGYVESGLLFEAGISGGAQLAMEEETEFEFGTLYKNEKFHEIIENDSETTNVNVSGFGELEAKFGIFNAVGLKLYTEPLVEASLKGGAYSTFGAYAGTAVGSKACFAVESGTFSTVGVYVFPDSRFRLGTEFEQKMPFVKPLDCEEIKGIEPKSKELTLTPSEKKKIKIEKTVVNLKNGSTDEENVKASKLQYTYNENALLLNEKTGEVSFKDPTSDKETVNISYTEDSKTFKTSVTITKVQDEKVIQQAVDDKKTELQRQYTNIFETKMLNSGRQLLTTHYITSLADIKIMVISVHDYNEKTGKWTKIFERGFHTNFPYKKQPISLSNNSLEQHVFFNELGSWQGEHVSMTVIGSTDGKEVDVLYSDESYKEIGTVETTKSSFLICDNGDGKEFKWNGLKFVTSSTSCQSSSSSKDILLNEKPIKNNVLYVQPAKSS